MRAAPKPPRSLRCAAALLALGAALSAGTAQADFPQVPGLEQGRKIWLDNCFGCHGDGLAGAPPVTDPKAWAPRIAKGRPMLYSHALQGFFGADSAMMPPRGGNAALTDNEVRAAVDYMLHLVTP